MSDESSEPDMQHLMAVAPILNALPFDPGAECFYEIMSDALIWKDEIPSPAAVPTEQHWAMRLVFRYRTTIIMGQPDARLEPGWQLITRLCPQWPGFRESRRSPSLAGFFMQRQAKSNQSLQSLFNECNDKH